MKMKTVYAREPLPQSIFLAGPTPRKNTTTPSWRPEALQIIEKYGFDGTVFIPENREGVCGFEYDAQVHWEWEALNQATIILFWVPRDIEQMPAFTTNVEFGMYAHSRKIILGYPKDAPKMSYLDALATRYGVPVFHTLAVAAACAVDKCEFRMGERT